MVASLGDPGSLFALTVPEAACPVTEAADARTEADSTELSAFGGGPSA